MEKKKTTAKTKAKNIEKESVKKVEKEELSKNTKTVKFNKEKIQSAVIVILSLIIVFGIAFVVPELKNCGSCIEKVELTNITMKEYREVLSSDEVSLIYLASPTCGYCAQQEPIMKDLIREYGFEVNYLNTSTITQKEADEVYTLYGSMQEGRYPETKGLRTPTILIVQNGKLLDMNLGNIELEELVSLLQNYTDIGE